jgi:glyoxylase-like metal-dependent hydrolase (beta-lactamase superfamily II)
MQANRGAIEYPFEHYPAAGATIEVAPGVHWLSTPLPFRLRAINLYLLEDGDGWTIVDCGYSRPDVRQQWEQVWATTLQGKPVRRLVVTHFHPDHAGNSAWICERWNLRPWMTQAEWLTANLAMLDRKSGDLVERLDFYVANGMAPAEQQLVRERSSRYADGVRLPSSFRRMVDGEVLRIGGHDWRIIVGRGHSPEHASLHCASLGLFIAGDQLLPEITTNVSVWPDEPEADALRQFLDSLALFARVLPSDTLVLPSHRRPFRGVQARVAEIEQHHRERLDTLLGVAAAGPVTTAGLLPHLFRGVLDGHQLGFAMGESLAHVNYLLHQGLLHRYVEEGITHYALSGPARAGAAVPARPAASFSAV